jgi:hypothetical protein
MARTDHPDVMLAKIAGAAQRAYPGVMELYRVTMANDALPIEIRRNAVAVIEAMDLLRFHIREATLDVIVKPKPKRGAKNAGRKG